MSKRTHVSCVVREGKSLMVGMLLMLVHVILHRLELYQKGFLWKNYLWLIIGFPADRETQVPRHPIKQTLAPLHHIKEILGQAPVVR